ncbi:MAG: hypothetical protein R3F37_20405 [Candidatus Competibacteraceae bacterium]
MTELQSTFLFSERVFQEIWPPDPLFPSNHFSWTRMAIPDYQTLMLPILSLLGMAKLIASENAVDTLADQFDP